MKPKQKGEKNIFRLRNRTVPSALVNNQKPSAESNLALLVKQANAKDCLRPSPYLHKT